MTIFSSTDRIQCLWGNTMIKMIQINEEWIKANTRTVFNTRGNHSVIFSCEDGLLYKQYNYPILPIDQLWLEDFERINFMNALEGQTFIRPTEICLQGEIITGYRMPQLQSSLLCDMKDASLEDFIASDEILRSDIRELSRSYNMDDFHIESLLWSKEHGFGICDFDAYQKTDNPYQNIINLRLFYKTFLETLLWSTGTRRTPFTKSTEKWNYLVFIFNKVIEEINQKESLLNMKEIIRLLQKYLGPVQTKQDILRKVNERMV